jgi:cytochrome c oxidase subunit 1
VDEAAAVMQLVDNLTGSSFFLPSGMVVSGQPLNISGGGSPLLWQHLFWFLGHPEVYILLLPAIGIVAEVIANNTRKPLWGYRSMVYAVLAIGFLSFIVWAHHMYLTGMGTKISTFFQTTTMMISIPSVILLTCLFISLWGGSIRFNVPMLFSLAFLVMFGIGGLTGLPLGFNASDIQLHDTYYVIAHFHYVVAPGIIFGFFAGVYHWFPKMTGRYLNEFWGKVHFWLSLIFMNAVFFPMFVQGLAGMHRRMADGGATYAITSPDGTPNMLNAGVADALSDAIVNLNKHISWAALCLAVAQIPFILNLIVSVKNGRKTNSDNPWKGTTLEWQTPTPPGHGNFLVVPNVYRGPYEYSVPGAPDDFTTQNTPPAKKADSKTISAK